jgi:actin-related protein
MDQKCVIIDCGSGKCKAGLSGKIEPMVEIPTVVWHPQSDGMVIKDDESSLLFSTKALEAENGILNQPIKNMKITDWDDFELFLGNLFKNELKLNPEEYGIFITEPPLTPKDSRERLTKLLFEKFNTPFIFTTNGAVLTSYGARKYSGFVLDCGYDSSRIVPIECGYPYSSCIQTIDVGGKDVSEFLFKNLVKKGCDPKKLRKNIDFIKEKYCYVNDDDTSKKELESKVIKLPDGTEIKLDKEMDLCPEILFHPEMINKTVGGIANTFCSSVSDIDHYIGQKFEWNDLIIAGGSSLFNGFIDRIKLEIGRYYGGKYKNRMKIIEVNKRNLLQFIGASTFSMNQIFKGLCTTKEEYNEYGAATVHNKCFY